MSPFELSPQHAHLVHFVFEWLGVIAGVQTYRMIKRTKGAGGLTEGTGFFVAVGCILGAAVGNKLLFVLEAPQLIAESGLWALVQGQSIVGGLLGGLIGVEIAKKLSSVTHSTGDDFVWPLVVGTVVGRIGCFLSGLNDGTYGDPTTLPWGMDFGDGLARHPTQLYDMLFVLMLGALLYWLKPHLKLVSGLSFKLYLAGYLAWRLFIDGFKPVPYLYPLGLSGIQLACLVALILYLPFVWFDLSRMQKNKN